MKWSIVRGALLPACVALWAFAGAEEPLRDPTDPDGTRGMAPLPGRSADAQPAIALRGLVVAKGRPGSAYLETGGELVRVEEGSTLLVGGATGERLAVTVLSVNTEGVTLSVAGRKEAIVLK